MLNLKEIATLAPAAMATKPAGHCSPQYVMLPTIDAIAALKEAGFVAVQARQERAAPDRWGRERHSRHMLKFRKVGTEGLGKMALASGAVPELVLTNSSDGSCPLSMELGFFRMICSNGLIAFRKEDAFSFMHRRVTPEAVAQRATQLVENSALLYKTIDAWRRLQLTPQQVAAYATRSLLLRVGARAAAYDAQTLVAVRRDEDKADTLWNVFNRVQENGMGGALSGLSAAGRHISARPITSITAELQFNKALWHLTDEVASGMLAAT